MNLRQIEDILNENLDYLVDMACYSGDIGEITKAENNIKSIIPAITQLLEELREEESNEYEITGKNCSDLIYADMGHNELARKINSKIDKILNK